MKLCIEGNIYFIPKFHILETGTVKLSIETGLTRPEGAAWVNPQLGSAAILDWSSMGQTALAALLPATPCWTPPPESPPAAQQAGGVPVGEQSPAVPNAE
jgi:hypothetical protein